MLKNTINCLIFNRFNCFLYLLTQMRIDAFAYGECCFGYQVDFT
jgi:hypothetical protein